MLGMRGLGKVIFLNTMFLLDPTIINITDPILKGAKIERSHGVV